MSQLCHLTQQVLKRIFGVIYQIFEYQNHYLFGLIVDVVISIASDGNTLQGQPIIVHTYTGAEWLVNFTIWIPSCWNPSITGVAAEENTETAVIRPFPVGNFCCNFFSKVCWAWSLATKYSCWTNFPWAVSFLKDK